MSINNPNKKNYYRDQRLEKKLWDNHVLNGFNMVLHEGKT
jgi:hypothetical protein